MLRDGVISDELWDVLESVMPLDAGRRGRPWNDHRTTLEGIIWRFRTGSPWRDLPETFGPYQSVWQRHRLWSTDGTYFVLPDDDQYDPLLVGRSRTVMAFLDGTAEPVATVRVPDGLYNPEADGTPMLGLHHWISDHEFVFWHACCGHDRCSRYDVDRGRVVGPPSECPAR